MDYLDNFKIDFAGMADGLHDFNYNVGQRFFNAFLDSPIRNGDLKVALSFNKTEGFFLLEFSLEGTISTECDRCLDPFDLPIEGDYKVIVKFDQDLELNESTEDDEVIFIAPNETSLDVARFIYEVCVLNLPLRKVHPEGKCNVEVTNYLDNQGNAPKLVDPRWEELAKITSREDSR